jgi:hypothetical protein
MVPESQTDLMFYSNGSRVSNRFDVILMVPESQTGLMLFAMYSWIPNFQYKKNTINLYTTHSMILLQHVDKGLPLVQLLYNYHYPAKVITR